MSEHAHSHPHHDHAHTHDHHHDEEDTYFIDQLCMVGLSGAFGVICLCLWFGKHFWQAEMLNNLLAEDFHPYVLLSGIALVVIAFTRGGILWFQSRDPNFLHTHHHHDHAPAVEQETRIQEKSAHLQTVPPMHDHVHGPGCAHDHAEGEACTHHEHEHGHHHHDHDAADHDHGWAPWRYVAILIPIILFMLGLPSRSASLNDAGYEGLLGDFSSIIYEAMPFIVLGVLLAGILEEFVPQQAIVKIVPRNTFLAVAIGGLLGLIFPMCECGIIVVMKRLLRKGLPLSVCIAYMLAGPVINFVVIFSTYKAFSGYRTVGDNPEFAVLSGPVFVVAWRVGLSYLVALVTAWIVDWQWQRHGNRLLHPSVLRGLRTADADEDKGQRAWNDRLNNITQTALNDFVDIMAFLVLGAVLAAGGKYLIRESNIQSFIQETPAVAIVLMMGIAILFCLCSEADAFVAANFPLYWPDASKLAFLVLGPMLDLKLLLMYTRVYRPRLIATIVAALLVQVFVYSSVVGYFFGIEHPPEQKKIIMPPNVESYLLGIGMGPDPLSQLTHFGVAFARSDARSGTPISYKNLYESATTQDQRDHWQNQVVEVRGQYDPQNNDHFFTLARMKIQCCRSDGVWLSMPVFAREPIKEFKRGDWVKITGSIEYRKTGPQAYVPLLMVHAASEVVRSHPDADPYVK